MHRFALCSAMLIASLAAASAQSGPMYSGTSKSLSAASVARNNDVANGPENFGAVGDGKVDDLAALISGGPLHRLGMGTYYAAASFAALPAGKWYSGGGPGRLEFCEGGKDAACTGGTIVLSTGNLSIINSAPLKYAGYSDSWIGGAFSGDLSGIHMAAGTNISGHDTLGTPAHGYQLNPLASMILLNLRNTSGWNQSINDNDGRTNVAQIYLRNAASGGGDTLGIYINSFVSGTKSGATSFLANAASGTLGGQVFAGANGVYLQGLGDINLNDRGYDVSGIGLVINAMRSNSTGALNTTWMMIRPQSQGPKPIDAFYSAGGKSRIGIDFAGTELLNLNGTASHAAIATQAGMLWFGNATNSSETHFSNSTRTGSETFGYDKTTGWTASVGGVAILQASGEGVIVSKLRISSPAVPRTSRDSCGAGQVAYDHDFAYFCVATNTWKRVALASW